MSALVSLPTWTGSSSAEKKDEAAVVPEIQPIPPSRAMFMWRAVLGGLGSDLVLRYGSTRWHVHSWVISQFSQVMASLCQSLAPAPPTSTKRPRTSLSPEGKKHKHEYEHEHKLEQEREIDLPVPRIPNSTELVEESEAAVAYSAVLRWIYTGYFGSEKDALSLTESKSDGPWTIKSWKLLMYVVLEWLDNDALLQCIKMQEKIDSAPAMHEVLSVICELGKTVVSEASSSPIVQLVNTMFVTFFDKLLPAAVSASYSSSSSSSLTHCSLAVVTRYLSGSAWSSSYWKATNRKVCSPLFALDRLAPDQLAQVDECLRVIIASHLINLPLGVLVETRPLLSSLGFTAEQVFWMLDAANAAGEWFTGPFFFSTFVCSTPPNNSTKTAISWPALVNDLSFLRPGTVPRAVAVKIKRVVSTDPVAEPRDMSLLAEYFRGWWHAPFSVRLSRPGDTAAITMDGPIPLKHKEATIEFGLTSDGDRLRKYALVFRPNVPSLQLGLDSDPILLPELAAIPLAFRFLVLPTSPPSVELTISVAIKTKTNTSVPPLPSHLGAKHDLGPVPRFAVVRPYIILSQGSGFVDFSYRPA